VEHARVSRVRYLANGLVIAHAGPDICFDLPRLRDLGITRVKVRALILAGQLDPVDADGGTGDRVVRWVTSASVRAYVDRARTTGRQAMGLCTRCRGRRYIRAGTTMCGPCADRLAQRAADNAFARQQRKNQWWRENGREWRAGRALQEPESTQQEGTQ
jgi:hypothetical protein